MAKNNKNTVSLAGEFAVLSQLALRGHDAKMTLGHTKGVDILVSIPGTDEMYRLEVKTRLLTSDKQAKKLKTQGTFIDHWMMSKKHESITDPLLFYCFVIIWKRTRKSRFFINPWHSRGSLRERTASTVARGEKERGQESQRHGNSSISYRFGEREICNSDPVRREIRKQLEV